MDTLFGFDDLAAGPSRPISAPRLTSSDRGALIGRIMELNASATEAFLSQFSAEQLSLYFEHLVSAQGPRGPEAVWVRPGDTRAVLAAESAA